MSLQVASAGKDKAESSLNTSIALSDEVKENPFVLSSMCRTPSCEWNEWEDTFDIFSSISSSLQDVDVATDVEVDQYMLADVDNFFEPVTDSNILPNSPRLSVDLDFLCDQEQDLNVRQVAGIDTKIAQMQNTVACKLEPHSLATMTKLTAHRSRKRKTAELRNIRGKPERRDHSGKKTLRRERLNSSLQSAKEQMEMVYKRRYDILYTILEAWNTGGIEDIEEIADHVYEDDVTLISPGCSKSLHGVEAVMSHWSQLLDVFPDGIMEEYVIERDEGSNETLKATWRFSGTQICPILGVKPRHKKVCINGTSFFTFKGDRIWRMVLSWNLRETMLKLMGVFKDKVENVVRETSVGSICPTVQMPHPGVVRS
ncbi:Polyketide cyclase SnoaL-like domain [Plasmopara halstedii]|uniref:Polyketide cyclase SnoaL-like domain n=1 Tax=Plasmopara halstedii TaxID=4781 RepID=A0A0P1AYZ5_PLAHL|nr:Polyketide cyclase SnoaL-like domain [Plasmopara halstedii]CEG46782.1 Polyketide cyclase SnoaL-like domain [Plasmopara halstedii]|eukprot:XP_024583151.1 Polyketide cyclase SnoaL-like domain [Plasmopara halstedii]